MCRVKPDIRTYIGPVSVVVWVCKCVIHVKTKVTVEMHVSSDICTYMGSVCVVGCVPGSGCVCMHEQVYMFVSAAHPFLHPSGPTRTKGCQ